MDTVAPLARMNIDSMSQLRRYSELSKKKGFDPNISIRINPGKGAGHCPDCITAGEDAKYYNTIPARSISDVVPVDYFIRGCPINTAEFLKVVKALLLGKRPDIPGYPVCVECKMAGNICVFERGKTCLGPVIRGGCETAKLKSWKNTRPVARAR
jgi:coenzyme F420-reducing hydrogenase gamma subunit